MRKISAKDSTSIDPQSPKELRSVEPRDAPVMSEF